MTFLEFNYMILQAYDFLELSRRVGVRLQMGGSDQWGNIVNGIELGRRIDGTELFGVTTPLITTADGAKMGKTAQGAVWLNAGAAEPLRLLAILAEHATTPTSAGSCGCSPTCRSTRSRGWRALRRRRDQRGQGRAGHRGHGAAARRGRGATPPRKPPRDVRRAASGEDLPTLSRRRRDDDRPGPDRDSASPPPTARPSARSPRAR